MRLLDALRRRRTRLSAVAVVAATVAVFAGVGVFGGTRAVPLKNAILVSNTNFGISGSVSNLAPGYAPSGNLIVTVTNPYAVPIDLLSVTVQVTAVDQTNTSTTVPGCSGSQLALNGTGFNGSPPSATLSFPPTAYPVNPGHPTTVPLTLLLAQNTANVCQNVTFQFSYTGTATYGFTSNCITTTQNSYTVHSGQAICIEARVNGGLTVQSGGAVYLSGATINGGLTSSGAVAVEVCNSTVNGGVSISSSSGFVMIGDDGDDAAEGSACAANHINGGVVLTGNGAGFELGGNSISSGVTITNNSGSGATAEDSTSEIEGNTMTGTLSCTGNSNISAGGFPNAASSKTGQCATGF